MQGRFPIGLLAAAVVEKNLRTIEQSRGADLEKLAGHRGRLVATRVARILQSGRTLPVGFGETIFENGVDGLKKCLYRRH